MVVSVLCGSNDVWWHVLWYWWLPVVCGKCDCHVCVLCIGLVDFEESVSVSFQRDHC